MNILEKYLKNSSKRLTNLVCLVLIVVMVIASLFGVVINTTIFLSLIGVIAGNNALASWQANNNQFSQSDVRSIVKGFKSEEIA